MIIERKAEKEIDSLDYSISERVVKTISKLTRVPRPPGSRKLKVKNGYRILLGKIRILYTVDDKNKIVTVYRVSPRDKAYR
ncbi:type II toxin-antitoxin system RelE/ParE family toxin [bacterium]|nr:type II toxin-antitoxin system RelE/ParE family toxin [bacterium]